MSTNHIDQFTEWWENAEEGVIAEGDRLIYRTGDDYDFRTATREDAGTCAEKERECGLGILARAPKPKPAWHDAVAVIAHTARFSERRPFVLTRTEDVLDPYNTEWITRDDLLNPIPLIMAKVTVKAVERVADALHDLYGTHDNSYAAVEVIAAALGLETE